MRGYISSFSVISSLMLFMLRPSKYKNPYDDEWMQYMEEKVL